jgi:ABC-2 type transport system ATP-binding protein
MPTLTPPALQLTGLTLAYSEGARETGCVLDQISLTVLPGTIYGLLGKPGAGKTSLLRAASGRLLPRSGHAAVFGRDPAGGSGAGFKAWLQGDPELGPAVAASGDCRALLAALEIGPAALGSLAAQSHTLQNRAALVPLLLDPAPLLLLDEHPGMTLQAALRLQDWLPDRIHSRGQALVIATQSPELIRLLCDRASVLFGGRLVYDGPFPTTAGLLEKSAYRIRLGGRIEAARAAWPEGLDVRMDGGDMLLTGGLPDQAALYGVLARARDLGLTLISVESITTDPADWLRDRMENG